jgi:hypothetical protein
MGTPSVMPRPVHQRLDALAAEHAQQVVLERKEKARGARIALAAGAPAKLIVDAPGLVAFRAEDVQAAESDHFIVLRAALLDKLVVDRLPLLRGHLEDFSFLLEQAPCWAPVLPFDIFAVSADHGGRGDIGNGQAFPQAIVARHGFRIAAQQNVRAAARHVRRNRDRALAPACAITLASRSCCLAFNTWCGMPAFFSNSPDARIFRWKSCRPAPAGPIREAGGCRARSCRLPASCR